MKRIASLAALVVLSLVLTGCGDSYEKVTVDLISATNKAAALLETVQDERSAKAVAPQMKKLGKQMQAIKKRAEEMGKPPQDEVKRITLKYQPALFEAMGKMMKQQQRIASKPELRNHLGDAIRELQGGL